MSAEMSVISLPELVSVSDLMDSLETLSYRAVISIFRVFTDIMYP